MLWNCLAVHFTKRNSILLRFVCVPPEHPSTAFSDRDKQTPTPVDDSPRAGLPHTDSGIGEEGHVAGSLNGSEMGLGLGLGLVGRETDRDRDRDMGGVGGGGSTDLLCSLSDVRRSQESLLDSPHNPNSSQAPPSSISSISQTNKGINVKVGLFDPHSHLAACIQICLNLRIELINVVQCGQEMHMHLIFATEGPCILQHFQIWFVWSSHICIFSCVVVVGSPEKDFNARSE